MQSQDELLELSVRYWALLQVAVTIKRAFHCCIPISDSSDRGRGLTLGFRAAAVPTSLAPPDMVTLITGIQSVDFVTNAGPLHIGVDFHNHTSKLRALSSRYIRNFYIPGRCWW